MDWVIENWMLIAVVALLLFVGAVMLFNFLLLPSNKQQEKMKKWMLWAVVEAEQYLKSGTGRLKLAYVYDLFKQRFPIFSTFMPYLTFEKLVDEALNEMRHLASTNEKIKYFLGVDDE